jgi:nitroreductase
MLTTAAATLGTAPIVIYHFYGINLFSIIHNLVSVPLTGVLATSLSLVGMSVPFGNFLLILSGWIVHLNLMLLHFLDWGYLFPVVRPELPAGLYRYQPKGHELTKVAEGDKKSDLFKVVAQPAINSAPAALIIAGIPERSTANPVWIYLEAGHAAENVYLQAVSLKLGTVSIAGFKPEDVKRALAFPEKVQPIYIMPVGRK